MDKELNAYWYSQAARKMICDNLKNNKFVSAATIQKKLHVSNSTAKAFLNGDFKKKKQTGRKKKLTEAQIEEFIKQCEAKRSTFGAVKIKTGVQIITSFNIPESPISNKAWIPNDSTVQKLFKSIGWKSRTSQARNPMSEPANKLEQVVNFMEMIKRIIVESSITPDKLWVMDESAIFSNSVVSYTYCAPCDHEAYVSITKKIDYIGNYQYI